MAAQEYWQVQLFILRHRLNSLSIWYCLNRNDYGKLLVNVFP